MSAQPIPGAARDQLSAAAAPGHRVVNGRGKRLVTALGVAVVAVLVPSAPAAADPSLQAVVDQAVNEASADGIQQSVAVLDRDTGQLLASRGGDQQYISESISKLFTVAYYESRADGRPDQDLANTLRFMIVHSDDGIESSLWNADIVPSMADRYDLQHTGNGPKTGPHDWGWELITADDEVEFLSKMSKDSQVGPLLMGAMANVAATGSDGFDQHFGMNALTGDHGSKQGWTDVGSTDQVQIHSVGWVGRYFVAILQTSKSSDYDTMRADSTRTAQAIAAAEADAATGESSSSGAPSPASTRSASSSTAAAAPNPATIRMDRHTADHITAQIRNDVAGFGTLVVFGRRP